MVGSSADADHETEPRRRRIRFPKSRRARWALDLGLVVVAGLIALGIVAIVTHKGKPAPVPVKAAPVVPETLPSGLSSSYVGRQGTTLTLNGDWFRFTGFDNFVMLGCGTDAQGITTAAQQEAYFEGLHARSVTRLWVFQGTDLKAFDQVLAIAAQHDQLVIPTLADGVQGCGESPKDAEWFRTGYKTSYLPWVRTVVSRYKSSTAVMMWDLINEPSGSDVTALRSFVDAAGALVHSLDPNHLVTVGTNLPSTYGGVAGYNTIFSSPQIDVVSLHEYDQVPSVSQHLADVLATVKATGKPVIIGEYGVVASPTGDSSVVTENGGKCLSYSARVTMVKAKLADYLRRVGVAGALYWSFAENKHTDCALETFPGDPLVDAINAADRYPGVARLSGR